MTDYIETNDGQVLFLDGGECMKGGFGVVYKAHFDCSRIPVAIKFMQETGGRQPGAVKLTKSQREELEQKNRKRFENEIARLKEMNDVAQRSLDRTTRPPFPAYRGHGVWNGFPFYVMEWLEPFDLRSLKNDDERIRFACELCDAVEILHQAGYVHYDIKPGNVLYRADIPAEARYRYVLADFGSVHEVEEHAPEDVQRSVNPESCSQLTGGVRCSPHTPYYADPLDDLHTVHADIYSIGQVLRDLFEGEVPPLWASIILRCTSRNYGYRYGSVAEVKTDVLGMGQRAVEFYTNGLSASISKKGATWYQDESVISVFKDGDSDNRHGRTFRTIQEAVNAAENGSVIAVGPGIYNESIIVEGKKVQLMSLAGAAQTVIRGSKGRSVIQIKTGGDGCLVKGFTLTGGTGHGVPSSYGFDYYGGGINTEVSLLVEDCIICGNGKGVPKRDACTFGGGVYVSKATATLRNCLIADNYAWACGGGLLADGDGASLVIVGCTVQSNDAMMFFGRQGGIGLANHAVLSISKTIVEGNGGDQVGAFGGTFSEGTRALVAGSYIEGGVRACNIEFFIDARNNLLHRPESDVECGCSSSLRML